MEPAGEELAPARWWPPLRRVDVTGLVLAGLFVLWVWLSARATGGSAGPLVWLVLGAVVAAALARWATHLHATGPVAVLAVVLLLYGLAAGEATSVHDADLLGALLAVGTGAGAVVTVRATRWWLQLAGGVVTALLALLAWRTGSAPAQLLVAVLVITTATLLVLPMRERRWVVVWPALVAVTLLFGTTAYAALPLPAELVLGAPEAERLEGWKAALDLATESPLYGTGPGAPAPDGVQGVDGSSGWARHEPLQTTAETGVIGGLLLIALLAWAVAWVSPAGGGPGTVIGGVVIAGSIAHACLDPIWRWPVVALALAFLLGAASARGGAARWRVEDLVRRRADGSDRDAVGAR